MVQKFLLSWPKASASPVTVAARYKAQVCGAFVAGIAGSNPAVGMVVSCGLSGRDLYDGPISRPEESYRGWCVLSMISKPQP